MAKWSERVQTVKNCQNFSTGSEKVDTGPNWFNNVQMVWNDKKWPLTYKSIQTVKNGPNMSRSRFFGDTLQMNVFRPPIALTHHSMGEDAKIAKIILNEHDSAFTSSFILQNLLELIWELEQSCKVSITQLIRKFQTVQKLMSISFLKILSTGPIWLSFFFKFYCEPFS